MNMTATFMAGARVGWTGDHRWPAWVAIGSMVALLGGCAAVEADDPELSSASPRAEAVFAPPDPDTIPATAVGNVIRSGYQLVIDTQHQARAYVGNALNCTNCHLDAGRRLGAAPFVGLTTLYPEHRARNARMNTLEDRLDDCFERSMNGKPLPQGGKEQQALVAYIAWLSQGVSKEAARTWRGFPRIASTRRPDPLQGKTMFAERCAGCHAEDGQGTSSGPPIWGPGSYNIAAGMARVSLAASFIKANMPPGQGGTLTDDEAYDLAAFINSQPRPDFARKAGDWPQGGKPADAPY
jgi:thiosulfate dehydrogenase